MERWLTTLPFVASLREKFRNWVNLKPRLLCPMRCHGLGRLMEATTLSARIGIAGTCCLLCTAVAAVASASAQTDAAGSVGKPLALLQFIHKNGKAKLRQSKTAAEFATRVPDHGNGRGVRRTVAETLSAPLVPKHNVDRGRRQLENATAQARQEPAPEMPAAAAPKNNWPTADPAAPGQNSILTPQPTLTLQPASAPITNEAVAESTPNESVAAGAPSVATTAQPAANASRFAPVPPQPAAAKPVPPAPMKATQAAAPEKQTLAETAKAAPAVQAMTAVPAYEDTGPIGSASWIARVVAALGSAFVAGAIAWFLIKPASRPVG